ncbi:hypothetical protein [Micromonospora sp. S4605]|uniref:hypothetical protein n=1 Tax=Micromonospora sp. S4605 TaxID=1420897 RepID=UPI0011B6BD5E|nr:hypothetical protein [Micromonospora sp. S4605]
MSSVALSQAQAPAQWCPEQLRTEQHEWGVAIDPKADWALEHGRLIQRWVNDQRSKGWGRVMTFHALRRKFAGQVFGDFRMRHDDPFWAVVDGTICDLLNSGHSGLIVVPIDKCTTCG